MDRNAHSDDFELSFITLATCTRNVMQFLSLQKQQTEQAKADRPEEQKEIAKPEEKNRYVDRRLKELAAFERRARGEK
jgi:hypothetical protein